MNGQSVVIISFADYPAMREAKAIKIIRLQQDSYQIVLRRYDASNGKPATPDVFSITRDGVKQLADGLAQENKNLQDRIDSNNKAIANLTGELIADMDALDKAAKDEGDL